MLKILKHIFTTWFFFFFLVVNYSVLLHAHYCCRFIYLFFLSLVTFPVWSCVSIFIWGLDSGLKSSYFLWQFWVQISILKCIYRKKIAVVWKENSYSELFSSWLLPELQMDNALIDDRRIHVDFSQSVAKLWSQYRRKDQKGKGNDNNIS